MAQANDKRFNEYLGDGLYADFDGYHVEVYAWNGVNKTNRVFFEPSVLDTFLDYVRRNNEQQRLA